MSNGLTYLLVKGVFKEYQTMPMCGCAYPSRPYDDEPLPFAEALQNQRCAIGFFVAPTLDCMPVFLRAVAYDYGYFVVFV